MSTRTPSKRSKPSSGEPRRETPAKPPESPSVVPKSQSHRLFTEEDEIRLLKAFRKHTKTTALPAAVGSLAAALASETLSSDFSNAQINHKLRNLRVKYHRLARTKSLIKTPHDSRIYKTARKIWGKEKSSKKEVAEPSGSVWMAGKEKAELENFSALTAEVSRMFPGNFMWREALSCLDSSKLRDLNNKWMLLQIEEGGISTKRAELFYEHSKMILEASMSSSSN